MKYIYKYKYVFLHMCFYSNVMDSMKKSMVFSWLNKYIYIVPLVRGFMDKLLPFEELRTHKLQP